MARLAKSNKEKMVAVRDAVRNLKSAGLSYAEVGLAVGISRASAHAALKIKRDRSITKCTQCGSEGVLHYHHKNYAGSEFEALCAKCHSKCHSNDHVIKENMGKFNTQKCHCCNGDGTELDHRKVGSELRRMRLSKGVSQTVVAQRMKFSKPYVSDLEVGARNWRPALITRYLKALR